jgi:hypothetical protein
LQVLNTLVAITRANKSIVAKRRDRLWILGWAGSRHLLKIPVLGRIFAFFTDRLFALHFTSDLRRLHDALADTDLSGNYWIWAGMLLGWTREGTLLAHDRDADFALLEEDLPRLLQAVPALRQAGFVPIQQFRSNTGELTELTFRRHSAKFEFFVFTPIDGMLRYNVYGWPPDHLVQVEAEIPNQELVPFHFLGRTWLKHVDHERELACMYGDWRVPQRTWNYLQDDQAAVGRQPWLNPDSAWSD